MKASTSTQALDEALTSSRDDGLPLTAAELLALGALASAAELPSPHSRACRASQRTQTRYPWNHTVHSATAARLEDRGLASGRYLPGRSEHWYIITPGGRAALDRAKGAEPCKAG